MPFEPALQVPVPLQVEPQTIGSPVHELVKVTLHCVPQVVVFWQQVPMVLPVTTAPFFEQVDEGVVHWQVSNVGGMPWSLNAGPFEHCCPLPPAPSVVQLSLPTHIELALLQWLPAPHAQLFTCPVQWSVIWPHEVLGQTSGVQQSPAVVLPLGRGIWLLKQSAPWAEQGHVSDPASVGNCVLGPLLHLLPSAPVVNDEHPLSTSQRFIALLHLVPGAVHPQVMTSPVHSLILVLLHSLAPHLTVFTQQVPLTPIGASVRVLVMLQRPGAAQGQARLVPGSWGKLAEGPFEQALPASPPAPNAAQSG